jgi:hypothetical protein
MSSEQRALLWIAIASLIGVWISLSQSSDIEAQTKKVEARQDRVKRVQNILQQHPQWIQGQAAPSSQKDRLALAPWFTEQCQKQQLAQAVVSMTPSHDSKKNIDKIKLQLKGISLAQAYGFIEELKQQRPGLEELSISIDRQKDHSWSLSGSWAYPSLP